MTEKYDQEVRQLTEGGLPLVVISGGTAAIGKLAANSGVDIGDVDVLTEPSGSGAYTTPTHTAVTVGATTTVALAANTSRLYALLVNDSDEAVYIKLGAAAVLNAGIRLNAYGGSYEICKKIGNLYTGAINAICTSGGKILLVLEGA